MKLKLALTTFLSLLSLLSFLSSAQTRPELTYITEQFPPYNYVEDHRLKGMSIDLLHLVWQRMHIPKQKINFYPWDRAYYLLQQQPNSVLFMTMKTPHRVSLFKWACPILGSQLHFFGESEKHFDITEFSQTKKYKVAASKAAAGEQLLINLGFPVHNIIPTNNLEQSLKLLSRGRVDFVISEIEAVEQASKSLRLNANMFTPYLLLSPLQGCFAFNQSVPDAFVREFDSHLKAISKSPIYDELLKRYNLSSELSVDF